MLTQILIIIIFHLFRHHHLLLHRLKNQDYLISTLKKQLEGVVQIGKSKAGKTILTLAK